MGLVHVCIMPNRVSINEVFLVCEIWCGKSAAPILATEKHVCQKKADGRQGDGIRREILSRN